MVATHARDHVRSRSRPPSSSIAAPASVRTSSRASRSRSTSTSRFDSPIDGVQFGIEVLSGDETIALLHATRAPDEAIVLAPGNGSVTFGFDSIPLLDGRYLVNVDVRNAGGIVLALAEPACDFEVMNPGHVARAWSGCRCASRSPSRLGRTGRATAPSGSDASRVPSRPRRCPSRCSSRRPSTTSRSSRPSGRWTTRTMPSSTGSFVRRGTLRCELRDSPSVHWHCAGSPGSPCRDGSDRRCGTDSRVSNAQSASGATVETTVTNAKGIRTRSRPQRIDQVIPSIVEHDAVSNHTFEAQRLLREMGFESEIYALVIGPGCRGPRPAARRAAASRRRHGSGCSTSARSAAPPPMSSPAIPGASSSTTTTSSPTHSSNRGCRRSPKSRGSAVASSKMLAPLVSSAFADSAFNAERARSRRIRGAPRSSRCSSKRATLRVGR